jgi:hypothetical protein
MFRSFNTFIKLLSLSAVLAGSVLCTAESIVEVENKSYWMCKNRKEVRTIRVQVDGAACITFYSKLGSEKNVGSGKNQESCVSFLNNIKSNLEKSNWNCRDISATRITASEE